MAAYKTACFGFCSSYNLGLFFILLVSLIWSAASILVQFLYTQESFDSPFLLTYIGVSLFTILLPTKVAMEQGKLFWGYLIQRWRWLSSTASDNDDFLEIMGAASLGENTNALGQYENVPSVESVTMQDRGNFLDDEEVEAPFRDEEERGDEDAGEPAVRPEAEIEMEPPLSTPAQESSIDDVIIIREEEEEESWTNADHMWTALKIAPVWFLANWSYNASLAYTSITSSTVLASTGSLFTFIFAVCTKDEKFTCLKLAGVLLGVMGSLFTALHDAAGSASSGANGNSNVTSGFMDDDNFDDDGDIGREDEAGHLYMRMRLVRHLLAGPAYRDGAEDMFKERAALYGDALGLISAIGYGGYAVMVRVLCPRNESLMSMELLLGYIGLFNMVGLSPILFYQLYDGSHAQLTWVVFGFLVVKGLLDNVLSDYLWARSVVLTSATVATVGLGLTIPLAFLSDVFWMGQEGDQVVSLSSIAGALSVLAGFILVNISNEKLNEDGVNTHQVYEVDMDVEGDREDTNTIQRRKKPNSPKQS